MVVCRFGDSCLQVTFKGVGRYKLEDVYRGQIVETAIGEAGDLELSTLGNR